MIRDGNFIYNYFIKLLDNCFHTILNSNINNLKKCIFKLYVDPHKCRMTSSANSTIDIICFFYDLLAKTYVGRAVCKKWVTMSFNSFTEVFNILTSLSYSKKGDRFCSSL